MTDLACHMVWFGISNTCGGAWPNGIGKNGETHEEQDEDCVKEGFQLARLKFHRDGE